MAQLSSVVSLAQWAPISTRSRPPAVPVPAEPTSAIKTALRAQRTAPAAPSLAALFSAHPASQVPSWILRRSSACLTVETPSPSTGPQERADHALSISISILSLVHAKPAHQTAQSVPTTSLTPKSLGASPATQACSSTQGPLDASQSAKTTPSTATRQATATPVPQALTPPSSPARTVPPGANAVASTRTSNSHSSAHPANSSSSSPTASASRSAATLNSLTCPLGRVFHAITSAKLALGTLPVKPASPPS